MKDIKSNSILHKPVVNEAVDDDAANAFDEHSNVTEAHQC